MNNPLNPNIAVMQLSDSEKSGLQIFQNYSRAFGEHRVKVFVERAALFEAEVKLFE